MLSGTVTPDCLDAVYGISEVSVLPSSDAGASQKNNAPY